MLAMSVRVSPWSALWRVSSVGRDTVIVLPSSFTIISACTVRESSPLGPLTRTIWPSISAVTPEGTVTGRLPIRDMASSYQITASSSPPRFAARASRSDISPFGVERMAIPRPFRTRGISRDFT